MLIKQEIQQGVCLSDTRKIAYEDFKTFRAYKGFNNWLGSYMIKIRNLNDFMECMRKILEFYFLVALAPVKLDVVLI